MDAQCIFCCRLGILVSFFMWRNEISTVMMAAAVTTIALFFFSCVLPISTNQRRGKARRLSFWVLAVKPCNNGGHSFWSGYNSVRTSPPSARFGCEPTFPFNFVLFYWPKIRRFWELEFLFDPIRSQQILHHPSAIPFFRHVQYLI